MVELWFYIAMMVGGPEHSLHVHNYATLEECNTVKLDLWEKMNNAYPPEEQKLYRFVCKIPKDNI